MVAEGGGNDDPGCVAGCKDCCQEMGQCCGAIKDYDCAGCCKSTFSVENLKNKLPIVKWAPSYRLGHFTGDLVAGLTVGLTVIPQGLAYAVIAELPPQYGLYSAFMGCFIYCFMGTSKDITLGPTAIMSLMTAAFGGSPIHNDVTISVVMTLFCGIMQFLMGMFKIGFLVDFISFPVITGFTTAAAITIACGQIKKWLGLKGIPREFIHQMIETFKHIPDTVIGDLVMGLIVMIILKLMKLAKDKVKFNQENMTIPKKILEKTIWLLCTARNAIVILLASVLAAILHANNIDWFTLTGNITPGLPKWEAPKFHLQGNVTTGTGNDTHTEYIDWGPKEIFMKIGAGLAIVPIMSVVETIAIGKAFARKNKYNIDANQELLAIGVSNVLGCFVQAYPVTGSFSRTAVNSQSGVMTPAGGIWTGALVLIALGLLTRFFYYIPQAALAGLIIIAVLDMVDFSVPRRLWKVKRIDLIPWLTTFIFSFIFGIEYGILIGIGVSLVLLLYPWARPSLKTKPASEITRIVTIGDAASQSVNQQEVTVVSLDSGFRFPAVEHIKEDIVAVCTASGQTPGQSVVLDCSHISCIDYTAVQGVIGLIADFALNDAIIVLANLQEEPLAVLQRANIHNFRHAPSVDEAIRMIYDLLEPGEDNPQQSLLHRNVYGSITENPQPPLAAAIAGTSQMEHNVHIQNGTPPAI